MTTLPLFPFFSLILACLLFMFMILKLTGKRTQTRLPGPWKLPIIGNLHNFVVVGDYSLPHRALRNLAKKYGPFMHLKLGEISLIVVTSAETTKEVLRNHDGVFSQRSLASPEANMYASKGLIFSPYGDYWRQLRRVCTQELLSPKRVKSFQSIREEEVCNLIEDVNSHKGSLINLSEKIFSLTYSITARAAFGNKCNEQQVFIELVKEGSKIAAGFNVCDLFPSQSWLRWISGTEEKLKKNIQKTDQILETIILNHKADKATRMDKDVAEETLLDVLFNAQGNNHGDHDFSLDTGNIKAVILDMFVAGGETSSTVVEWATAEMIKNPTVMKKAQEEVRQVFGGKENVDTTTKNVF